METAVSEINGMRQELEGGTLWAYMNFLDLLGYVGHMFYSSAISKAKHFGVNTNTQAAVYRKKRLRQILGA